jgi:FkbM family methyltransferase
MNEAIIRLRDLARGFLSNFKFSNRFCVLYNRIFRRNARLQTYIWKNAYFLVCDSSRHDHISVAEIFCDRMYDPYLNVCAVPGPDFAYINVGANIGAFDVWLVSMGLNVSRGIAVELNPLTCQRCVVNLQANDIPGVQLLNLGMADRNGYIDFIPTELSLGDNIFGAAKSAGVPGRGAFQVELVTLESLLERQSAQSIQFDLLKLDCEGAEYGIIRSTSVEVLRRFRNILIELHREPSGESFLSLSTKLESCGFARARQASSGRDLQLVLFVRDRAG